MNQLEMSTTILKRGFRHFNGYYPDMDTSTWSGYIIRQLHQTPKGYGIDFGGTWLTSRSTMLSEDEYRVHFLLKNVDVLDHDCITGLFKELAQTAHYDEVGVC